MKKLKTTLTISGQNPESFITTNKGRIKIYKNNKLYLKDKQNFEIELFNNQGDSVLAKILLNDKEVSSSGLILRPGERVFLERFLDDNKKFSFSTYNVDNNKQVKKAIKNNGLIKVEFYRKSYPQKFTTFPTYGWDYYDYRYKRCKPLDPRDIYPRHTGDFFYGTCNISCEFDSTVAVGGTLTTSRLENIEPDSLNVNNASSKQLETGRVEEGSESNQSFTYSNEEFQVWSFHTIEYQILPISILPLEVKDVKRKYCTECGSKQKKGFKFCPQCGEKQ